MSHVVAGLDVGSSSIKCIVAERRRDGRLRVLSAFSTPSRGLRKGVVVHADDLLSVMRQVVTDIARVSREAAKNIVLSVGGAHIRARLSRASVAVSRADQEIQEDDVERVKTDAQTMVKLPPNYTVLHNIVSEFFVDGVGDIHDPVGMIGNRLEVESLIVEAFAPHVNSLIHAVQKAGGLVSGVIFAPLAVSDGILTKRQKELGVLLLDIGFGTTSFVIYEEGKAVHTGSIPLGSGHITNDVAIGLRIPVDLAEKLKLQYGCASSSDISRKEKIQLAEVDADSSPERRDIELSRRFLAEIIEVRVEEILDWVHNEVQSFGRTVQLPAGVILSGGGAELQGLGEFVREKLKLPVMGGAPDASTFDAVNPSHRTYLESPQFSAVAGLARWGGSRVRPMPEIPGILKRLFKNLTP